MPKEGQIVSAQKHLCEGFDGCCYDRGGCMRKKEKKDKLGLKIKNCERLNVEG